MICYDQLAFENTYQTFCSKKCSVLFCKSCWEELIDRKMKCVICRGQCKASFNEMMIEFVETFVMIMRFLLASYPEFVPRAMSMQGTHGKIIGLIFLSVYLGLLMILVPSIFVMMTVGFVVILYNRLIICCKKLIFGNPHISIMILIALSTTNERPFVYDSDGSCESLHVCRETVWQDRDD